MEKILNILYQSDNNYAVVTGVSIISLLENNRHLEDINIYLLNDQISEENLSRLKSICEDYHRNFIIVDTEAILKQLKDMKVEPYKNTYTTYFKLLVFNQLDISTNRIIQLDGDTIINGPLDELIDMPLDGYICAATYASIINDYKKMIGLKESDKYYNCGVLVINLKEWKHYNCQEKIIHHLLHERNKYFIVDQDIINTLFRDKIKYMHLKYNFNSGYYIYGIKGSFKIYGFRKECYSDVSLVKEAYEKPYIYHCMGAMTGRPWEQDSIHPQNKEYDFYLDKTPWRNEPKKIVNRSTIFKIQRKLFLILPRILYIPIHRLALKKYMKDMNDKVQKS